MLKAKELICFYNGHFMPIEQAGLPMNDLGVQRGYGIFDFLRISNHIPLYIDDHLSRFFASADEMRLPLLYTKEEIKSIILHLIKVNQLPHAGIRMMLTGGVSTDGYTIESPNLAILLQSISAPVDEILMPGLRLISYPHQRQLPHIKTTDYLMAIWLYPMMKNREADDILYQQNGIVSECPRSNFFIVLPNQIIVTPLKNILHGITRKQVLQIARDNGFVVEERELSLAEIRIAKEAFITSSTKRIIPIAAVDDIVFEPHSEKSVSSQLFTLLLHHENDVNR
jgi:branched-chain amino acid aminotransferase